MKLSEVFSQLAYGELSQLGLVNETQDGINPLKYGQVVAHVNMGLLDLFKRFNLKESHTIIELKANQMTYLLNTNEDTIFIEDSETPEFVNDILKIERVYTEFDYEMALNDESEAYSCFTPSMTTLRVPYDVVNQVMDLPDELKTNTLKVVYRANHPMIVYRATSFNPANVEVQLPSSHLWPLLLFVASRVHNPIGMSNEFHAGNSYAAKYEKACQELEVHNIRVDQGKQNSRLVKNGWV